MSEDFVVELAAPNAFEVTGRESTFVVEAGPETTVEVTGEESFTVMKDPSFTVVTLSLPGPTGPPGPVGLDLYHRHVQAMPAALWVVNHNLGKFPSVTVVNSAGDVVVGDVKMLDLNTLQVSFTAPFGGEAYCN